MWQFKLRSTTQDGAGRYPFFQIKFGWSAVIQHLCCNIWISIWSFGWSTPKLLECSMLRGVLKAEAMAELASTKFWGRQDARLSLNPTPSAFNLFHINSWYHLLHTEVWEILQLTPKGLFNLSNHFRLAYSLFLTRRQLFMLLLRSYLTHIMLTICCLSCYQLMLVRNLLCIINDGTVTIHQPANADV